METTEMSFNRWRDEEDVVHTHNEPLLSHRKGWHNSSCSNMEATKRLSHYVKRQKAKDKCHTLLLICGIQTMTQISWSVKQTQTHRHRGQICSCQGQGGRGGVEREFGISRCTLLQYKEWINNQAPLYGTGNYIQYPVISHNGKEQEKECTDAYDWVTVLLHSSN